MNALPKKIVVVSKLSKSGVSLNLHPDKEQLEALADASDVSGYSDFEARISVVPWRMDGAKLEARVKAEVEQVCVNTLEPVISNLGFEFLRHFAGTNDPILRDVVMDDGELVLEAEGDDPPDEIIDDRVDLWQVILEELILHIEPYPRIAGSEPEQVEIAQEQQQSDETVKPFAGLADMLGEKDSN